MEKQILGDYKILKEIGRGSLGTTYITEHRFLRKSFALKVLPPELSNDLDFLKRFETHIHNVADFSHPNMVKIHNISYCEGVHYVVSDLIVDDIGHPTNLAQYLNGRVQRLVEEELMMILRQVAYAIDAIHEKIEGDSPFYHGGLKLNNILMGKKENGVPHIYLSDTGFLPIVGAGKVLSRIYQSVASSLEISMGPLSLQMGAYHFSEPKEVDKLHLWHRSFLQSYAFLSPEQKLSIKKSEVSRGSDVYSFGVLAYFMLMGEFPEGVFTMPSKVMSDYRYDWDTLITKCLSQHVEKRPLSLITLLNSIMQKELHAVEKTLEEVKPQPKVFSFDTAPPPPSPLPKIDPPAKAPQKVKLDYMQTAFNRFENTQKPQTATVNAHVSIEQSLSPSLIPTVTRVMAKTSVDPLQEQFKAQTALQDNVNTVEKKPVLNPPELRKHQYEENPGAIFQTEPTVERYIPKKKEVSEIEPLLTDMAIIEGGEYYRGSDVGARDEKPRHRVILSSFALDIHPVTNEQFVRFLEVMGGEKDVNNNDIIHLKESRIKRLGGKLIIESGYAKHPVVGVSWYGAVAYAKWIGKRLPTEAEWEVGATSGTLDAIYPYGQEIERSQANFFSSDTTAVKSYPANEYGLYDVVGNVYEWCQDWYDYNSYETSVQEPNNPPGPVQGVYRVLRGGCWKSLKEDLRCSHRHRNNPGTVNRTYGFRCAADVS
jgi:formylglycine-generating enzyme required for sulfatase activity